MTVRCRMWMRRGDMGVDSLIKLEFYYTMIFRELLLSPLRFALFLNFSNQLQFIVSHLVVVAPPEVLTPFIAAKMMNPSIFQCSTAHFSTLLDSPRSFIHFPR